MWTLNLIHSVRSFFPSSNCVPYLSMSVMSCHVTLCGVAVDFCLSSTVKSFRKRWDSGDARPTRFFWTPPPSSSNRKSSSLFVCLFVLFSFFPTLSSSFFFGLPPKTKRIKWERREDLPDLGAPFCSSIHQVREKHNAIWLFVVSINVVVAHQFLSIHFLLLFFSFSLYFYILL